MTSTFGIAFSMPAAVGNEIEKVSQAGAISTGDAAGQLKATTVGEAVTGMRGARVAARAFARAALYPREPQSPQRELMAGAKAR